MGTDPTAIPVRLSRRQTSLIFLGLNFIVNANQTRMKTGIAQTCYPFQVCPPPLNFDHGKFDPAMMEVIESLWDRLRPKRSSSCRIQLNIFQLYAAILGARVAFPSWRKTSQGLKNLDPKSKRILHLDETAHAKTKRDVQRVVASLERQAKRAVRLFERTKSRSEYVQLSKEWRAHVRWVRVHLVYMNPMKGRLPSLRKHFQRRIDSLVKVAEAGLRWKGYQLPNARELRLVMRRYQRYCRAGRLLPPQMGSAA